MREREVRIPAEKLLRKPVAGGLLRTGRKKLHGSTAGAGAGKSHRFCLPSGIRDDGDFRDFVTAPVLEIKIAPGGPPLPTLEILEDREDARLGSGVDFLAEEVLHVSEFVGLHRPAEAEQADAGGFDTEGGRHGSVMVGLTGWRE